MARPRSDDKKAAIVAAATEIVASQGIGASTASIANHANVSNGSLFNYFPTKADLLNQLFVDIKLEMAEAVQHGLSTDIGVREQVHHMWNGWLRWAVANPDKRRALGHLTVSGEITPESRKTANMAMGGVAAILEESRRNGPMKDAPLSFVASLMSAIAESTIDFMASDPDNATRHSSAGFDALWRVVT